MMPKGAMASQSQAPSMLRQKLPTIVSTCIENYCEPLEVALTIH